MSDAEIKFGDVAYRQGDVYLVRVDPETIKAMKDVKPLARDEGKAVMAYGEVTGHHHCVLEKEAQWVGTGLDYDASRFLVTDKPVQLKHIDEQGLLTGEHATIEVEPGAYQVFIQREYQPGPLRESRVID